MAVEFKIVRGARAGAQERFEKSVISIGRHPMNDLRFDPTKDPDCSSRHAEMRAVGGHYFLRDIGSTNGTFVNGERIVGEKELLDGDTISFGFDGPQVTLHVVDGPSAAAGSAGAAAAEKPSTRVATPDEPQRAVPVAPVKVAMPLAPVADGYLEPIEPPQSAKPLIPIVQRAPDPLPPSRHPPPPPMPALEPIPLMPITPLSQTPAAEIKRPAQPIMPEPRGQLAATMHGAPYRPPPGMTMSGAPPRRNTEVRIAEAVKKQTSHLSKMLIGLTLVVIAGGSVGGWFAMQAAKSQKEQFATLMAANDSLARALEQRLTQTGVATAALREARSESERLARELRATQERGGDISALSTEMRNQQQRTSTISRMDFSAVTAANKAAIVFIVVEMTDGKLTSGTGFNILPGGLVVTNKHVVRTADGTPAARVAVSFDGQRGWKEATIEFVSETDEIALLRLVRPGNFPVVSGVAREARDVKIGDPVAILGYPLGTSTAGMSGNIDELRPEATLGVGTVSKILTDVLQLDAFAAQGSSGSPVFDSRGLVVGVLYGAAAESGGRIIYCVPSARLAAQLPSDAAAVLR